MSKKLKFTFKTVKPTGRYRSFYDPEIQIKLNGKVVGNIQPNKPHKLNFRIIKSGSGHDDGNKNCKWMWIRLKKESESIDDAKKFANEIITELLKKFTLQILEDNTTGEGNEKTN